MKFYLQYVSDVHLEFRQREKIVIKPVMNCIKNLALCGDIGYPEHANYIEFIIECSKNFENVFVIFGNHEFYSVSANEYGQALTMNMKKCFTLKFPKNVYFLDNDAVYVNVKTNKVYKSKPDGKDDEYVKIIGSTLWSNVTYESSLLMNDCKCIFIDSEYKDMIFRLSYYNIVTMFNENVKYILGELDKEPSIRSILLTHHGTHPICLEHMGKMMVSTGYVSSIPELYKRKNLLVSISGHTHSSIEKELKIEEHIIKFLSNTYGYPHESKEKTKYKEDAFLEL